MKIKPIRTKADQKAALREIESLMGSRRNSPEGERLNVLVTLVEAYERKHFLSPRVTEIGGPRLDTHQRMSAPSNRQLSLRDRPFRTSESPRLYKCVVAWMDVLGIADIIKEAEKADRINDAEKLDQSNELLVVWYNTLKNSRAWLEGKNFEWVCDVPPPRFFLKAFSDNIIMVWPIQNYAPNEAGRLLREALAKTSMFQRDMAANNFFLRGAITVGEIFIDELTVFGPALIRAHELEQSAGVPRVILDDLAMGVSNRYRKNYSDPASYPLSRYIEVGADGLNFVNYLEGVISPVGVYCDENTVRKHRDAIVLNLSKFQNMKGKTWHKYRWAAAYHNSFCDLHSHLAGYKITCDETELPV